MPLHWFHALGAALLLTLLLAGGAAAGEVYPPQGVTVVPGRVDNTVVREGDSLRLQGSGYVPGTLVRLEAAARLLEQVRADERGAIDVRLRLEEPGTQVLAASGRSRRGGLQVVSATVRVTDNGTSSLSDGFADSDDVVPGLLGGLTVVVVAAISVFAVRVVRRPATGS